MTSRSRKDVDMLRTIDIAEALYNDDPIYRHGHKVAFTDLATWIKDAFIREAQEAASEYAQHGRTEPDDLRHVRKRHDTPGGGR